MISSAPAIVARTTSIAVSALFTTTITPADTYPHRKHHNIAFDAVCGSFSGRGRIDANGKQVLAASLARYIARISET